MMEEKATKNDIREMTNEEYRNQLKEIFDNMDDNRKLRFWFRYIRAIEKDEI